MSLDVSLMVTMPTDVFSANITHNLGEMALLCGLYKPLWRPEEIDAKTAADLIEPIKIGLANLHSDPKKFKQYNPSNGWGDYDGLVKFASEYLDACMENPDAKIHVSR